MLRTRRRLGAFAALALAATSLTMLAQSLTTSASAAELLQDGSFEAATGAPLDSPAWAEADTGFGSPLCTVGPPGDCGTGDSTAGPRTGDVWAWFGGSSVANQVGSLSQEVTIPLGDTRLSYYYYNGNAATPADATLQVKVDGAVVKTHAEAAADEPGYALVTVNLKAYSDGNPHVLSFEYDSGPAAGDASTNMSVDDISLQSLHNCAALKSAVDTAKAKADKAATKVQKAKKKLKAAKNADNPDQAKIDKLKKKLKAKKKALKKAKQALKDAQAAAAVCNPPSRPAPSSSPAPKAPTTAGSKGASGANGRLS